jgi:hypothetical protein
MSDKPQNSKDLTALRARSQQQQQQQQPLDSASSTPQELTPQQANPAPKRDKFAAKQARMQQQQQQETAAVPVAPAQPRRDKFAAKAARQQAQAASDNNNNKAVTMTMTTAVIPEAPPVVDPEAVKRYESLKQARQKVWDDLEKAEACIGELLREVAHHGLFDPDSLRQSRKKLKREKKAAREKKRIEKENRRNARMADTDDDEDEDTSEDEDDESEDDDSVSSTSTAVAENTTPRTAQQARNKLDDNKRSEVEASSSQPHERYSKILSTLHSLCAPHAHWIQAYRPLSTTTTRRNLAKKATEDTTTTTTTTSSQQHQKISMYQARVEMRLAQEKRNICQEWLRLEREALEQLEKEDKEGGKVDNNSTSLEGHESRKRKLEEVA